MEHLKCFAVRGAHADFETHPVVVRSCQVAHLTEETGGRTCNDPTHFEAANFPEQDTMFGIRGRSSFDDHAPERFVFLRHRETRRQRLCDGRQQCSAVGKPHRDRQGERCRAPGKEARVVLGDDMQVGCRSPNGPDQCRTQGPIRAAFDEHPCCAVAQQRCTGGKGLSV